MKISVTLIILIIKFNFFDCQNLMVRDVKISLVIDGEKINLEAYHSKEDKKIIKEKDKDSYQYLEWYSIGIPVVIESERSKIDNSKSFFHFTSNSFYGSIQMLTSEQKQLIVQEIKNIHNITVRENQIEDLKPSKLKCKMTLFGSNENEESQLQGEVKSFKSYPLKLELNGRNDSLEQKWLEKALSENKEDIEIFCDISSKNGFKKQNYKLGIKSSCILGGSFNCPNNRKCLNTGSCECPTGYHGITCSECEY